MPVGISTPNQSSQTVNVNTGTRLVSLGAFTVIATLGTKHTICERADGAVSRVQGYVDLSNLASGDTLVIKLYAKVRTDGSFLCYNEEAYYGVQSLPLVYITEKPETHGLKVTIQQIAGICKKFDYEFFEES